jgi:inosine-uridine nucleoside N-ribohydrolase
MTVVVLDTDIGTDIDDTWALAMLLGCGELDLRLVVTATGDTTYRARLAAAVLAAGGRDDVPIGIGVPTPIPEGLPLRPQERFAENISLDQYQGGVHDDGVEALVNCVMSSYEPVTIVAIGPLTNVAAALEREPLIASKARVVGMHGSVRSAGLLGEIMGTNHPVPEYNVVCDVEACRSVFEGQWETTITPLDTCASIVLHGDRYAAVCESTSPVLRAVQRTYAEWFENFFGIEAWANMFHRLDQVFGNLEPAEQQPFWQRSTTVLFDTVAVYLAYDESLLNIERLRISLDPDGLMRVDPGGAELRVATSWRDLDGFHDHLLERLRNSS